MRRNENLWETILRTYNTHALEEGLHKNSQDSQTFEMLAPRID